MNVLVWWILLFSALKHFTRTQVKIVVRTFNRHIPYYIGTVLITVARPGPFCMSKRNMGAKLTKRTSSSRNVRNEQVCHVTHISRIIAKRANIYDDYYKMYLLPEIIIAQVKQLLTYNVDSMLTCRSVSANIHFYFHFLIVEGIPYLSLLNTMVVHSDGWAPVLCGHHPSQHAWGPSH